MQVQIVLFDAEHVGHAIGERAQRVPGLRADSIAGADAEALQIRRVNFAQTLGDLREQPAGRVVRGQRGDGLQLARRRTTRRARHAAREARALKVARSRSLAALMRQERRERQRRFGAATEALEALGELAPSRGRITSVSSTRRAAAIAGANWPARSRRVASSACSSTRSPTLPKPRVRACTACSGSPMSSDKHASDLQVGRDERGRRRGRVLRKARQRRHVAAVVDRSFAALARDQLAKLGGRCAVHADQRDRLLVGLNRGGALTAAALQAPDLDQAPARARSARARP